MSTKLSWIFLSLLFGVKAMAFGDIRLVVGTYTDGGSHGIYSFSLNEETGASKLLDSLQLKNPSYLVPFREGRCLLAVSEMSDSTASLNAIRAHGQLYRRESVGLPVFLLWLLRFADATLSWPYGRPGSQASEFGTYPLCPFPR